MMFQVRVAFHTWKSGTPTERFVLRHKPEIISHKKLRHILAGEEAVTDLGGGDVHYGSVYELYVVGAWRVSSRLLIPSGTISSESRT